MNLADIVGGQVVIHPDMLAIPPFKKLWDSFKDKDLATKYLWYIVLKNKYDSPYVETMERDLIEPTLKKELFGDENYELPEIQAEDSWKSRTYSLLEYMLDGLLLKLEGAAKYYHLSKDDEMDLDSIKKLTDGAKNMAGVIESIVKLKSQVRAEEIKNSKVRGGGEMNPFELPKRSCRKYDTIKDIIKTCPLRA